MINKLVANIKKTGAPIVVGLDPMLNYIPEHVQKKAFAEYGETLEGAAEAIWQFNKEIVDKTYDLIPAVKPQIAMYEQFGLETYVALGITDTNHASGESHFVDGHHVCYRVAHGFNPHVGPIAGGDFLHPGMYVFCHRIDGIGGSSLLGQCQLVIIHIYGDDDGTAQSCTYHSAHAHHAATDNHYAFAILNGSTTYGMEPHTHRLNQRTITW